MKDARFWCDPDSLADFVSHPSSSIFWSRRSHSVLKLGKPGAVIALQRAQEIQKVLLIHWRQALKPEARIAILEPKSFPETLIEPFANLRLMRLAMFG